VNDPVQRRFQYRITAPLFRHHRGTIDVIDLERRHVLVVYSTEADPAHDGPHDRSGNRRRTRRAAPPDGPRPTTRPLMGRKILFITTDQQRYDTLGCNGGTLARTPVIDALAAEGIRYERATPQSVVCMPSRSTIITGQHPSTHGVWMNGVPLPADAPSVAVVLREAGYRTALVGKPHFEPFLDPFARFAENQFARRGMDGPHRGFEHFESATHGAQGPLHYAVWLAQNHPEAVGHFYPVLDGSLEVNAAGGGATGAPQVHDNAIRREWYHTDWVADRTIAWLESLGGADDWFCWMSFPDPHHPWDPPASDVGRVDWRDVPLPAGYLEDPVARERVLDAKPRHWRAWYDGTLVSNYERPSRGCPRRSPPIRCAR
jgi:arylsulfatase A-like enzyme